MTPMTSTLFAGQSYDPDTRVLTVKMRSGATYSYEGVPLEVAETFAGNASPGAYFNRKIVSQYKATKL